MIKLKVIALLLTAMALCSFSYSKVTQLNLNAETNRPEILYLPSGRGLELVSFGYRNTLAHFLWFQTINYFGKHYRADRNYEWLAHYCSLVSTLSPKNRDYYQFCGTMLAWEAGKIEESIKIYSRAISAYPDDWLFYYLRGFIYAFFLRDDQNAKTDFVKSAKLPNASHFVARLAARKIMAEGNIEDAKEFLKEAIEMASDESTKSILMNRLRQIEASSPRKQENLSSDQIPDISAND